MYISREQIHVHIAPQLLINALDDNSDGAEDEGLFEAIVAAACTKVDALLSGRYTVPFPAPYPALAVDGAKTFFCYSIYQRKGCSDEDNPFKVEASATEKRLTAIGAGKEPLSPDIAQGAASCEIISGAATAVSSLGYNS